MADNQRPVRAPDPPPVRPPSTQPEEGHGAGCLLGLVCIVASWLFVGLVWHLANRAGWL